MLIKLLLHVYKTHVPPCSKSMRVGCIAPAGQKKIAHVILVGVGQRFMAYSINYKRMFIYVWKGFKIV